MYILRSYKYKHHKRGPEIQQCLGAQVNIVYIDFYNVRNPINKIRSTGWCGDEDRRAGRQSPLQKGR